MPDLLLSDSVQVYWVYKLHCTWRLRVTALSNIREASRAGLLLSEKGRDRQGFAHPRFL